ncbi:MAG: alpha amylase C-terminal domain-containing protein [Myxococcales bacterium]|nr:alpha amylase C-terminal domain-containing protein [Myxococcales bacterium]
MVSPPRRVVGRGAGLCAALVAALGAAGLGALTACGAGGALPPDGASTEVPEPARVTAPPSPATSSADAEVPRPLPANRGPGVHLTAGGALFRVWAPGATAAWVEGDFATARAPLRAEDGGFFAAEVAGVRVGARYRFVLAGSAGELARLDPYCRQRTEEKTTCLVTDPRAFAWRDRGFQRPKRQQQVVYELHVGSFAKDEARGHGTFATARARLAELAELGVNVVELMPVFDFGGGPGGWGYNPHLHFAPRASLGTAEELRALVDEAHARGIAVWLDAVVNHHDGWSGAPLRCFDGACPDGSAGVYYFGPGPYARTPWGPRPDFAAPTVRAMFLDATQMWLDEFHGDGFRWDSTSNVRAVDGQGSTPGGRELLVAQNELARARGATSTAEDLKGYAELTRPVARGGYGFDAQWDGFGYDVARVLEAPRDDDRDLGVLVRALTGSYEGDPFARVLFTETHDTVGNGGARLPSRVDRANPEGHTARRRSMLGAALLFTTPGVPMLFMGQEGLATGGFADTPAPLAPPTATGLLVRAFYKDLIGLRRDLGGTSSALAEPGVEILHRNDVDKVLVFRRHGASGTDVIVALNLRDRAYARYDAGVPAGGAYRVRLTSERRAYGADRDASTAPIEALAQPYDGRPFTLPLALGPYGVMVLSR